jgi:hypothetical protein
MKMTRVFVFTVFAGIAAHADYSYTVVTKSPAGESTAKHYIKGQKSITDNGTTVTVLDFDAQTMTIINKTKKTYSVKPFSEIVSKSTAAEISMHPDVKKTGQHKNINGFDAEETVMTMTVDANQSNQPGAKRQMQMEYDAWLASDVPGIEEMRAFHQKNAGRMPWAAMAGGNPGIAEMLHMMAAMHGVPVLAVMKMGSANPQQQAQMDQARARKKQGGPQAAMADQMLARMGGSADYQKVDQ